MQPDKIIVVGAGPSGLLLALLLAQKNIPVTVIESQAGPNDQPRATHYAAPAVKELVRAGLMEEILSEAVLPSAIAWRQGDGGTPITTLKIAGAKEKGSFERLICLPLNKLCRLIHQKLTLYPAASILWSTKVTDIGQDEHQAWVTAQTSAGIRQYQASHGWDDINYVLDKDHWFMAAKISPDGMWRVAYGEPMGLSKEKLAARQPLKYELMLPGNPERDQYQITNFSPYKVHQRCVAKMRTAFSIRLVLLFRELALIY
ncbi:hypothetical protein AbraIFM66950_009641 [Aspergillus brasiliensis]|nr:hypothetical protein AbraIFM66950_009641 [Aspergillus brasiliensis]